MTLKIEFQSDIKGYERVQKVLEETQKALNESANAMQRMNAESAKMTSGAMDIKGIDSIKNASVAVQQLAKSFDQVMSNQSGMRGFLTTFSGFRKEIGELNKEQGLSVLDTMSKQMESFKTVVSTGMDSVKKLRRELKEAEEGNQPEFLKEYKRQQYNEAAITTHGANEALNKLQIQNMMRQPILQGGFGPQLPGGVGGGLAGFLGGGTNLMRLMGIGGGIAAGVVGARHLSGMGLNALYTNDRAENAEYALNRDVYESAFSGNVGRDFMRRNKIGHEGRLLKNIEEGDGSFFGTKMGDSTAESLFSKIHMATSALITGLGTGKLPNATQMLTDKQNQMAELDSAKREAMNDVVGRARAQVTSRSFMGLEAGKGFGYVRELQSQLTRHHLTLDEGAPALFEGRRYGVEQYAARSGLARDSMQTGVSDRARNEIFRRQSYGGANAYNDYGRTFSAAGASGIDTSNMSNRLAISDVLSQRTMNIAGSVDASSVNAPFTQALGAMGGVNLSAPEKIQAAAGIQNMVQGRMGQAGTMESMGADFALMELGVKEAPVRAQISQLISAGNTDAAVKLIANLTGKDPDTIRTRLNIAKTQADEFRKIAFFGSKENAARVEKAERDAGLSGVGSILSGDANGVMGKAGMTEAIERTMPFAPNQASPYATTKLPTPVTGEITKGMEAQRNEFAMQQTAALTSSAKDEAGKLVEVFTGFLTEYRSEIQAQLGELKQAMKLKSDFSDNMSTMNAESFDPYNINKANNVKKSLGQMGVFMGTSSGRAGSKE